MTGKVVMLMCLI